MVPSPEEPTEPVEVEAEVLDTTNEDTEESGEERSDSELTVLLENPALLRDRINQFLANQNLQLSGPYYRRVSQTFALPQPKNIKAFLNGTTDGHAASREKYAQFLLAGSP